MTDTTQTMPAIAKPLGQPAEAKRRRARPHLPIAPPGHKRCRTCKATKLLPEFAEHNRSRDGRRLDCRQCCASGRHCRPETLEQRTKRRGGRPRLRIPAGHKRCRTCRETKPLEAFAQRYGSRDGRRNDCRQCVADGKHIRNETPEQRAARLEAGVARKRHWKERNPEAAKASRVGSDKRWRQRNPEKAAALWAARKKRWREKNREAAVRS